jgi:hypothetical protein
VGVIVVYPQGLNTPSLVDPQGNKPGWQVEVSQAGNVGNIPNTDCIQSE